MKRQNFGSNFDDFLKEEGLLADIEAAALKKLISMRLEREMKKRDITKSRMAATMRTSRSEVDRLLNPKHPALTLHTLCSAAVVLGKRVKVQLVQAR